MRVLEGKSVFSGIAIGKISILQKADTSVKRTKVENPEAEITRVQEAKEKAVEQLQKLYDGFCDGIAENVAEVLQKEGVTNYELHEYKPTTMDRFIGFLISPIVQGILIMIIIGGIYFELQTPGIGFPLVAAITACLLYFAPLYLEGMANYVEMILFVVGIILLLLEIFVIPGFGVTGVLGIVCVVASLVLAGIDDFTFDFLPDFTSAIIRSLFFVVSCSLLSLFGSIWLSRKLFGSRRLNFALHRYVLQCSR